MTKTPLSDTLLQAAAERFGTPLYVYDLTKVREQVVTLQRAVPGARLLYAVKANASGAVLRWLHGLGTGAEVITVGELERTLRAGIPAEHILLGGPGQDTPLLARARAVGVGWVSLDSASQWALWRTPRRDLGAGGTAFLPRLNPALDPRTHEHLATGAATSKFGMPLADLLPLAQEVEAAGRLAGFHVHIGSQISSVAVYDEVFQQLALLFERFPNARTLNIGGGFAVPDFPLDAFARALRDFTEPRGLDLLLEPGRYLVADAGVLLARVLHVKEGPVRHVIADAGMADLLRPALYGATHPVRLVGQEGDGRATDVDGPLCENADRLGRSLPLPDAQRGDLLAVQQVGAYGFGMASNYASSLRPAEAVWDGETLHLAREREQPEDLWRLERP